MKHLSALLIIAVVACGCGGTIDGGFGPGGAGSGPCTSGQFWTGGNRGSGSMNPGMACVACHAAGEGPRDAFMGTAFPSLTDADLCRAANVPADAVVEILDANDVVQLTLPINTAGNFYSSRTRVTVSPYKARVRANGKTNAMGSQQTNGDCNTCHTAQGASGAPGRITIPQ